MALNRTRNTINGFTGINARWTLPGRRSLRAFLTMPVARLPNNIERDRLRDNEFELDQEPEKRVFWGLYLSGVGFAGGLDSDWYLFGLHEKDRPSLPTRNRDFLTAGLRLRKATDSWAFEFESALQSGEIRATLLPIDVTDLDHRAWFAHVELSRDLAGRYGDVVRELAQTWEAWADRCGVPPWERIAPREDERVRRWERTYGPRVYETGLRFG